MFLQKPDQGDFDVCSMGKRIPTVNRSQGYRGYLKPLRAAAITMGDMLDAEIMCVVFKTLTLLNIVEERDDC